MSFIDVLSVVVWKQEGYKVENVHTYDLMKGRGVSYLFYFVSLLINIYTNTLCIYIKENKYSKYVTKFFVD